MRAEHLTRRMALVERAMGCGELPTGTDASLVIEAIFATLTTRLITLLEQVDEGFAIALVDLVLAGARAGGGVPR